MNGHTYPLNPGPRNQRHPVMFAELSNAFVRNNLYKRMNLHNETDRKDVDSRGCLCVFLQAMHCGGAISQPYGS